MEVIITAISILGLALIIFGYLEGIRLLPGGDHVAEKVSAVMVSMGLLALVIDALLLVGWGFWCLLK